MKVKIIRGRGSKNSPGKELRSLPKELQQEQRKWSKSEGQE
jgi:hypothetical protein